MKMVDSYAHALYRAPGIKVGFRPVLYYIAGSLLTFSVCLTSKMAVVGTRIETMREGDTNVAVKTDIVVDTETGLVVERKTFLAEVQTEDGGTAIIAAQKTEVSAIQVGNYSCITFIYLCSVIYTCTAQAFPPTTKR